MNIDTALTVSEAADYVGVTPGRIRQMICVGDVDSTLRAGRRWIAKRSLRKHLRHSGGTVRRGRPRISEK